MATTSSQGKTNISLSSLPLQILLYLNLWYFGFFWIVELLMYIYKGSVLPYPAGNLTAELILLFLMAAVESTRIFLGQKGNLTERKINLLVSIALSIPITFCLLFLLLWQTYVLRAELITCGIQLAFIAIEAVFSIIAVLTFQRYESTL
ncbi:Transmembrane protein 216 [Trichoplax sp. H2]|nr:Transmembrane protein 216 [Trichoplax sp. H2]|eukprot:RDD45722.1 Transmembrane protein 216 [Trichoplax sp. H2]